MSKKKKIRGSKMAGFDFFVKFRADDKVTASLSKLQTKLEGVQRATEKTTKSASKMSFKLSKQIDSVSGKLRQQSQDIASTALSFVSLAATIAMPIKSAIEFEEAMAEIKKVVDGTPESFAQMEKSIFELSKTIPLLPKQLTEIVAAGGRLGIPADKLMGFADTVSRAAVAFDMSAEQAGNSFASLSNKMGIPIDKIGELGDAVNQLANTTATTAPAVINILGRLSGTMKQLKIPPELGAGIAAFADQIFVSEELAASGVQQFVSALARTNKQFGLFTKLQNEGADGFKNILKSMQKLDITQLTEIFGVESARAIATMSGNLETFDKTLAQVADKTKFAGSMNKEFAARSATTANQIQLMKNSLNRLFITIGSAVLPAINKTIKALEPLLNSFADWASKNQDVVQAMLKVGAGIAALVAVVLLFKIAALSMVAVLGVFKVAIVAAGIAFKAFNLIVSMNPLGLLALAIAGVIGYFGGFDSIISTVKDTMSSFFSWLSNKIPFLNSITSTVSSIASALGFSDDVKISQEATLKTMHTPLDSTVKNQSNVNVNLQAQGLKVKSIEQSSSGSGLNVGINTLGAR
ncbi:MAG: phage tail tape measure protein [Gammaproteobacteria bacterium]|nr:phage tail tape measure protein [Gammaproteobacteria bacterium]